MAKVASGVATRMSQAIATSQPPPHTPPSIRAMTGAGKSCRARTTTRKASAQPSGSRPGLGISPTSWPADQTFALGGARRTTARTFCSRKASSAVVTSPISASLSALRFSRWVITIVAIESWLSVRISDMSSASPLRSAGERAAAPPV